MAPRNTAPAAASGNTVVGGFSARPTGQFDRRQEHLVDRARRVGDQARGTAAIARGVHGPPRTFSTTRLDARQERRGTPKVARRVGQGRGSIRRTADSPQTSFIRVLDRRTTRQVVFPPSPPEQACTRSSCRIRHQPSHRRNPSIGWESAPRPAPHGRRGECPRCHARAQWVGRRGRRYRRSVRPDARAASGRRTCLSRSTCPTSLARENRDRGWSALRASRPRRACLP